MKYILNSEGYIYDIAFGTEIECDLGTSTLYAGEVPTGYSTLEEWHDGEIDKLNAWKIVDGNLVFDNARYNELQSEWEKEATENKQIVKKDLKNIEQMLTSVSDTNKSQYVSDSTDGKIITVSNASNIFPSVKVTDIDPYSYNKLDFIITGKNMLKNDATSKELNGMSFTQNADRSITINGTATSDIEYNIGGTSLNTSPFLCFKKGIEYYLSGLKGQTIKMYYFDGTNRTQIYSGSSGTITFTDSDKLVTQIVLSIPSGKVIKKVTLYPMLSIDEIDKEMMNITLYGKSTQEGTPTPSNHIEVTSIDDSVTFRVYNNGSLVRSAGVSLQNFELCSLPNGVKDELVIENGRAKIIKKVGKYYLTGNEAWALSGTESQPYITFSNIVSNCKLPSTASTLPNLLSNYYSQSTRNNLHDGCITLSSSGALIIYDTVHNTSLANFKTWLKTVTVAVYYELVTPIEVDLGFSDDLFFVVEKNIKITNDDNADMKIDTTTPNYKEYKGSTFFIDFTDYIKDGLFPSDELFPSDSLYPQGTTISYIDVSNNEIKAFINDNMEYLGEGNIPIFEGCNTLYTLQDTFLHYEYSTNVLIYNPSRYGANEENPTLKSSYHYKNEWEVDGTTYTEEYTDDARFFSNGLKFVEDWSNDYPESTGYGKWKNIIELYNDYKFPFFELRKELDTGYWNSTTISPSGIDITDSENISYNSSTHIYRSGITTPTVTQTSLKESKKNFEKLNNALEIINDTDIYKYNLKYENDDDKKHIGFVIGDDFKYSKEITSLNNDGVDIYSMISVCFKAIQEQQMIIEKLENKIKELEVK